MEPAVQNLSLISLIVNADPVVQFIMAILLVASLWSWTVAFDKWGQFGELDSRSRDFEKTFWSGRDVADLDDRGSDKPGAAMARVFAAGAREWRDAERMMSTPAHVQMAQERADRLMGAAVQRELTRAGRGLPVLATIAASTPFIGLFGTVWGIMNSFTSIASNKQTDLTVVAPGIAEALIATALGLAAAIPAVIFYNKFSGDLDRLADRLESFTDEVAARFSRRASERV